MVSAVEAAGNAGIVLCAAAGNNTNNNDITAFYPASYHLSNMIVVAASDQNDQLAIFSNYGSNTVDFAGPGGNIFFTTPTNLPRITAYVKQALPNYTANPFTHSGPTTAITAASLARRPG